MIQKVIYPLPAGSSLARKGPLSVQVAFSNAVKVGPCDFLFISGQLAFDEAMNLVGKGDMRAQTHQVLGNLGKVLSLAGASFESVVRIQVFVTDLTEFQVIHEVRHEYFPKDHLPASTLMEVQGLVHPDALIEIEAVAVLSTTGQGNRTSRILQRSLRFLRRCHRK